MHCIGTEKRGICNTTEGRKERGDTSKFIVSCFAMLRRLGFGRASTLEALLAKPNINLRDLFEHDDQLLQEVHLQNPKLISLYVSFVYTVLSFFVRRNGGESFLNVR